MQRLEVAVSRLEAVSGGGGGGGSAGGSGGKLRIFHIVTLFTETRMREIMD